MVDLERITTICFDADGTLWDFEQVMRHALDCTIAELERRVPSVRGTISVDEMIAIRNRVADEFMGGTWTHEDIRLEAFRRTLAYIGNSDEALARGLTAVFFKHRYEDIQLYGDVLPTLDALRERYTLGLLTNGNTYPERCGLPGYFQFVVIGQDYALQKPDPQLFEIAMKRGGCSKHEMVYVGDSLRNDVAGAKQVGIATIWLNRHGKRNSAAIEPDREITSLTELLTIL